MTNFQSDEIITMITVENDTIEKVDRYKYLGQTVMLNEHTREEVKIRIKAGWSCFGRYKDILCDTKLPMSIWRRMYNQCVIPTMTDGAETWRNSKTNTSERHHPENQRSKMEMGRAPNEER